ncbi:ABC transporter permease [Rhodovastum atsumiense]|uniref:ABC transporter permease n=2 Tax=Rhodovastum atsumiense TaxID=504468 RepID=A0A5M6ITM7_9PROT|nr:ABC transporter permease [Rhodovastum atsumiense]
MNTLVQDAERSTPPIASSPDPSFATRRWMVVRDLAEAAGLWRLCWTLAWFDIRLRYRGSVLGPFWLTLSTGAMVGAMGIVYATLFKMNLREYLPFLALSLVLWGYLNTLVGDGCVAFISSDSTIRSVRMPYSLYAARVVIRNILVLGHNVAVIIVVYAALDTWPGATAVLALPGIVLWLIDSLAICLLLGAVCARFRDIPPIVNSVMQMAFFISAVIWKPEQLGPSEWILTFNPFYTVLEVVRGPLLGTVPSLTVWVSALAFSALACLASWLAFVRVRERIAFWV